MSLRSERSERGTQQEDSMALGCEHYLLLGLECSPHPRAQRKPCPPGALTTQEDPAADICALTQLGGSACLSLSFPP